MTGARLLEAGCYCKPGPALCITCIAWARLLQRVAAAAARAVQ